jgi:hypothetical protein
MLVIHRVAVRDHTGGIKAETSCKEGQPELHTHERVVEAEGCSGAGFSKNFTNGESSFLVHDREVGKGSHCQGRADHGGELCQVALERVGEDEKLGLSIEGRWPVLQFVDEYCGLLGAIFHVSAGAISGAARGSGGNEPVSGMLDVEDARRLMIGLICWGSGGRRERICRGSAGG